MSLLQDYFNTSKLEPVYSSVFCVKFGYKPLVDLPKREMIDYNPLDFFCCKITQEYFHFNVNAYENKALPLKEIDNLINSGKKLEVLINLFNKTGDQITSILLDDVQLLKIEDLLNFDSGDNLIVRIKVKYKHLKMNIFDNEQQLKNYQRKKKLKKLEQI